MVTLATIIKCQPQTVRNNWSLCTCERNSVCRDQRDQIGRFLKVLGHKIIFKSSPNVWWILGLFKKHHFWCKQAVWGSSGGPKRGEIWTNSFYNIWSHWLEPLDEYSQVLTNEVINSVAFKTQINITDFLGRGFESRRRILDGHDIFHWTACYWLWTENKLTKMCIVSGLKMVPWILVNKTTYFRPPNVRSIRMAVSTFIGSTYNLTSYCNITFLDFRNLTRN